MYFVPWERAGPGCYLAVLSNPSIKSSDSKPLAQTPQRRSIPSWTTIFCGSESNRPLVLLSNRSILRAKARVARGVRFREAIENVGGTSSLY